MNTIRFNTGRLYTRNGQPITATLHDDGVVTFMDHGRGIAGSFVLGSREFNERTVMEAYDWNKYHSDARSWRDGMTRGACNGSVE